MLGGLGSLLLLCPVYHVTNGINVGIRLELERVLDLDLSPRIERTRTERLDKTSSWAATERGHLYADDRESEKRF